MNSSFILALLMCCIALASPRPLDAQHRARFRSVSTYPPIARMWWTTDRSCDLLTDEWLNAPLNCTYEVTPSTFVYRPRQTGPAAGSVFAWDKMYFAENVEVYRTSDEWRMDNGTLMTDQGEYAVYDYSDYSMYIVTVSTNFALPPNITVNAGALTIKDNMFREFTVPFYHHLFNPIVAYSVSARIAGSVTTYQDSQILFDCVVNDDGYHPMTHGCTMAVQTTLVPPGTSFTYSITFASGHKIGEFNVRRSIGIVTVWTGYTPPRVGCSGAKCTIYADGAVNEFTPGTSDSGVVMYGSCSQGIDSCLPVTYTGRRMPVQHSCQWNDPISYLPYARCF